MAKGASSAHARRRKGVESWSSYIYKVLNNVHPEQGFTKRAMCVMSDMMDGLFEKIDQEAQRIKSHGNKKTLTSREIQTAVKLCLHGELAIHAINEATEAVKKFSSNSVTVKGKAKSRSDKETVKVKAKSRSARAGLVFPVGRVHRYLRKSSNGRTGGTAAIYLAAVLEYVCAEILELAGHESINHKMKRITNPFISNAVRKDEELSKFFCKDTIAGGGVLPHIHPVLLLKNKKGGRKN